MLIQLMLGVRNLAVMVTVGVVIALEKLISRGELVARITGVVSILGGIALAASSIMGWHLRLRAFSKTHRISYSVAARRDTPLIVA